jgi:hypothetical protein
VNQQDDSENKEQTAPLTDLALNTEREEETKGGRDTSFHSFPGFTGGVFVATGDVN